MSGRVLLGPKRHVIGSLWSMANFSLRDLLHFFTSASRFKAADFVLNRSHQTSDTGRRSPWQSTFNSVNHVFPRVHQTGNAVMGWSCVSKAPYIRPNRHQVKTFSWHDSVIRSSPGERLNTQLESEK